MSDNDAPIVTQSMVNNRVRTSRERVREAIEGSEEVKTAFTAAATNVRRHALLVPEQMSTAGIWLDPTSILAHAVTNATVKFALSLVFKGFRGSLATVSNGGLVIGGAVASVLQSPVIPLRKNGDTPLPRLTGSPYRNSTSAKEGALQKPPKQLSVHEPDVLRVIDPRDHDSYVIWLVDDMKDRGMTLHQARLLIEGITIAGVSPRVAGAIVIVERELDEDEPTYWDAELPILSFISGTQRSLRTLATRQQTAIRELAETRDVGVKRGISREDVEQ